MKLKIIVVAPFAFLCISCANVSTLSRTTTLPPTQGGGFVTGTGIDFPRPNPKADAIAIHLDAPQRLAFAKEDFVCAEPSPDALQAYASSQALSLDVPSEAEIKFANALASSAGSIGLRTQSITLMRDHLYRICEASYNKQITTLDVAQLLRRSQDMTLGVLAIEQLTGAVAASQVIMAKSTNANASKNLLATKEELDKAREKEKSAGEEHSKRVTERDTLIRQVEEAKEKAKKAPEKTEEERTAKTALQTQAEELEKKIPQANKEVDDANTHLQEAKKVAKEIKANFDAAGASASAIAEGEGKILPPIDNGVDKESLKSFSEAVRNIVTDVTRKGHLTDSCVSVMNMFAITEAEKAGFAAMAEMAAMPKSTQSEAALAAAKQKSVTLEPLHSQCKKVFEANIKAHQSQVAAYAAQVEAYVLQVKAYEKALKNGEKGFTPPIPPTPPMTLNRSFSIEEIGEIGER